MYDKETKPTSHTHISFLFTDGTELHFDDPRRFATAYIRTTATLLTTKPISELGPEPDTNRTDYFFNKIK